MRRFLFLCLIGWLSVLRADEWSHVVPEDMYKALTLNQRATVDKALRLYDKGGDGSDRDERMFHKNAANEWERFRVQHGDTADPAMFAYSLFMQAMSENRGRERHTAVKTFTEVLDFFPDEIWLAAPGYYFRARTHFAIGDDAKGLADLQAMLDDPDYRRHPLAGHAYNRVAQNHWENKRTGDAVDMWKTARDDFGKTNRDAAWHASQKMRDWMIVQGNLSEAYEWFIKRERRGSDLDKKVDAAKRLFDHGMKHLDRDFYEWYFKPVMGEKRGEQKRDEIRTSLREWFYSRETLFAEAGRAWEFLMIRFDDSRRRDRDHLDALIPKIITYLKSSETDQQEKRARQLVGRLADIGEYESALALLSFYPGREAQLWGAFEIETRRKTYEAADRILEQLLAVKDPGVVAKARRERADLYHRRMGKYEEAIKLYYEINDPPETLWKIADCQRRNNQKSAAQNTLTEIASIFPDEAARAVYAKAEHFRQDGEKKMAVGLYRNLLSHPEWKKTGQASRAHDRLEAMGIATGGAVIHDVN